eukprot:scaffold874_cov380-Prasinococcus_capsulatus_cf.AAC.18
MENGEWWEDAVLTADDKLVVHRLSSSQVAQTWTVETQRTLARALEGACMESETPLLSLLELASSATHAASLKIGTLCHEWAANRVRTGSPQRTLGALDAAAAEEMAARVLPECATCLLAVTAASR